MIILLDFVINYYYNLLCFISILPIICAIIYILYFAKYIYMIIKLDRLLKKYGLFVIFDMPKKYKYIFKYLTNNIYDINDDDGIIEFLITNKDNCDLILDTFGGYVDSNERIINHILEAKLNLNIYVFRKAHSAGTMLAFTSNKLYLDDNASLSPTDPQIDIADITYSIKSLIQLCNNKIKTDIMDIYMLNYYNSKCLYDENINILTKLLNNKFKSHINKFERNEIINKFSFGNISHNTCFNKRFLEKYIKIYDDIPEQTTNAYNLLYKIMKY